MAAILTLRHGVMSNVIEIKVDAEQIYSRSSVRTGVVQQPEWDPPTPLEVPEE